MVFEEIINRWVIGDMTLGQIQIELQSICNTGFISDVMCEFFYENENENVERLFKHICEEKNVSYPTVNDAYRNLAILYAKKIIDAELSPAQGARVIFNKIGSECDGDIVKYIEDFEALSSEHDDFSDDAHIIFYGSKKCSEELQRIESSIVEVSSNLITCLCT